MDRHGNALTAVDWDVPFALRACMRSRALGRTCRSSILMASPGGHLESAWGDAGKESAGGGTGRGTGKDAKAEAEEVAHKYPPPPPCACTALSKHGLGIEPPF